MKHRQFISLPLLVLFLTLTSTVLASNTWYADGLNGSDTNECQTALTACKTIGHAISLSSSGDSIIRKCRAIMLKTKHSNTAKGEHSW